jgi:hypothetical protein
VTGARIYEATTYDAMVSLHYIILELLTAAPGQTRSFGDVGPMSGLPESGNAYAMYE